MKDEILIALIAVAALIVIILIGYVKSPPDVAYIITGFRKKPKMLLGKAGIRIPLFERVDKLSMKQFAVDVKTSDFVQTNDFISTKIDCVATIKISPRPELMEVAIKNFLNKNLDYIIEQITPVLEGNVREIIGQMQLRDIVTDRKQFATLVSDNARPDLEKMGLEIITFNIQSLYDKDKVIDDLGIDNTSKIKKDATIARTIAEKEMAIAKSNANKESNEVEVAAQLEIANRNNELRIEQANLKRQSDIVQAEADAAYEIQKQEQRKTIEISTANATLARQEKEIDLQARQVEITEKSLEAEIKKKAEADRFARQQQADADLYERQKEAEARKAEAEADRYAKEQDAEAIRMQGEAEAEAIRAKGLAEAEAIDKKAEAMKKYGEAAILEMYFNALPDVIKNAASPLSQVDHITMYGEGNSTKLIADIMGTVTQTLSGLKESTGVDVQGLLAGFLGGKLSKAGAVVMPESAGTLDATAAPSAETEK